MTGLWTGIALLTAMAIGFVFWPFLQARRLQQSEQAEDRQSQNVEIFRERVAELDAEHESGSLAAAEYDQLKRELERNLLNDARAPAHTAKPLKLSPATVVTVTLLALLIPVMAFGLYAKLGRSVDLDLALRTQGTMQGGGQGEQERSIEDAVALLEAELKQRPENAEGWYMLATTYISMKRFEDGLAAFRQVLKLLPEDAPQYAGVMGQYAQALFFANGGRMSDEVREQAERTLAIEPFEITTLGLLGIDAFEQEDYQAAIDYWSKGMINADGEAAESLRSGIASAAERLRAQGVEVGDIPALRPAEIRVRVSIDPATAAGLAADQTVFVFARPVGGRMPLAASKLQLSQLPADVVLNDSLSMSPQARLSLAQEVEVTARISLSGQPQATAGDLFGTLTPVAVRGDGTTLELVIDQVVE